MNELQVSICQEVVEAAEQMPTDAVIDMIKEGYCRLPFEQDEVKTALLHTLGRFEAIVDSRQTNSVESPSFWGRNQS